MRMIYLSMVAVIGLAACETTEGLGRDVSNLGNEIETEAQEAQ
ncbi:entericidin A/B family lipoprotein [Tritonibacter scottomollicae]|uniref:Entericidin EcnA/B family protein n=1 Tax=Tritonibacter scottomollicae TaxID=483013 RepID=A0A2T1AB09_TRISK|nr:entericidin A/B family lipoprotein [Tritonibacter scottomollicae]PRZ45771.1 entericidin EcnA/B family protein [Tritonibacter scottomollicae]